MKADTINVPSGSFAHPLTIVPHDIDHQGHVNNVVYVSWVQQVATAHWLHTADEKTRAQFGWVLLRHEIDYLSPAFLGEEVTGHTWIGNHDGPKIERYVALVNTKTSKMLAVSKTLWCLLDAVSKRPKRIDQHIVDLFKIKTL